MWKKYLEGSIMWIVKVIQVKQFCGRNAWKTVISSKMWKALCDIIHKVESESFLVTKLSQWGKFAKKTSIMWTVCQQNFHNVEHVITKPPHWGKYANKTSTMWKLCLQNIHNAESMLKKRKRW